MPENMTDEDPRKVWRRVLLMVHPKKAQAQNAHLNLFFGSKTKSTPNKGFLERERKPRSKTTKKTPSRVLTKLLF